MSRLIFEGDTISRFGKKIPTPFIEKLKIYQDSFECTISIYFHITENPERNEEIYEDLSNLKLFYGFGQTNPVPVELNLGQDDYFALVDENIYNSEGQRFAKFSFIRSEAYQQDFQLNRAISDNLMRETYFSCFIAVTEDERDVRNSRLTGLSTDDQSIKEFDRRGNYNIYSNVASPLVYEKVFTAPIGANRTAPNRIATDPRIIYEDSIGLPYESIPLQSVQKDYYKTTDSFREDLKKQIDDLVASYGEIEDQQLQSFLDSISYVSETQNRGVEFIVELDKIRNSFPSRTSTSPLGILYNRLKTIIFSANDALILGESLQKKIVPNTKLVDMRGIFLVETPEWSRREEASYVPRVDDTGNIIYPYALMERQQIETPKIAELSTGESRLYDAGSGLKEPNFDVTSIFGYFFFDYEKALHKKSNISQIYDVQKLLNIFGNNVLDTYFRFERTELRKFYGNNEFRRIVTAYADALPLTQLFVPSAPDSVDRLVYYEPEGQQDFTEIPYVVPRAFETVDGLEDYRLIAFEFQDFEPSTDSEISGQSYRFNVFVDDNTLDFYEMLTDQFETQIQRLKEYLEFAEDFCSYNNIDNRFNDFFAQGVDEYFGDRKPWQVVPKLYTIHVDLVRDRFSGIRSSMARYSEEQINLISPQNGTLEQLRDFTQTVEEFYNNYYSPTGEVTIQISARRSPDGTRQPSLRDNVRFIATLGYDNLPNIVDFTVDPRPPTQITLWNGNQEFVNAEDIKSFINSRAATLAMARGEGKDFNEFIDDEGGVVTLDYLDAVFENTVLNRLRDAITDNNSLLDWLKDYFVGLYALRGASSIATSPVLAPLAAAALMIRFMIIRTKRRRVRRIIKFINKFLSRLPTTASTYSARRALINGQIDFAISDDDNRPPIYRDLTNSDKDFIASNRAVFGNIGLTYIKSEGSNLIQDTSKWFRSKTRNIRN